MVFSARRLIAGDDLIVLVTGMLTLRSVNFINLSWDELRRWTVVRQDSHVVTACIDHIHTIVTHVTNYWLMSKPHWVGYKATRLAQYRNHSSSFTLIFLKKFTDKHINELSVLFSVHEDCNWTWKLHVISFCSLYICDSVFFYVTIFVLMHKFVKCVVSGSIGWKFSLNRVCPADSFTLYFWHWLYLKYVMPCHLGVVFFSHEQIGQINAFLKRIYRLVFGVN